MSKTPLTDAIIKKYKDSSWLISAQLALLASELEQQLNDAIADRDMLEEKLKVVRKNLIAANKGAERNMQALNISCKKLIEARDGWKEAAYSLGEALPPSWDELQPPAEQLRKFKEMVALENEETKKLLDNADKPEPRIWDVWLHTGGKEIQTNPDKWYGPNEWKQIKVQEVQLLDNADKHSKMYP